MRGAPGFCEWCFWGDVVSVTGGGLLELWGGMAGIKGGNAALEPICSRGNCGGQNVVMQVVGGRRRSSADGMVFFSFGAGFSGRELLGP